MDSSSDLIDHPLFQIFADHEPVIYIFTDHGPLILHIHN